MESDLLTLAKEDGFVPVTYSQSRGGQYNGPCPWCKGTDRFRIQPNHEKYGWFICNQCGRKGSAINYLMMKRGMSRDDARQLVGWTPEDEQPSHDAIPSSSLNDRPTWQEPPQCWQETARSFAQYCQEVLWSEQGKPALEYLYQRGLKDHIIKDATLGYYPRTTTGSAKAWGQPVHLRQGIVIPWFLGGSVWRLTIRDEQLREGRHRYKQVAGGSNGLYLSDALVEKQFLVLVTEGELDALSLLQECGDVAAVVATGTTQGSHIPRWVTLLAQQEHVFIAFDAETKGDKAAQWWIERLKNTQRYRPTWKDVNQMLQDGVSLRQWLAYKYPAPSPLCCVCGSDVEHYSEQGIAYCSIHWKKETPVIQSETVHVSLEQGPIQKEEGQQVSTIQCIPSETFVFSVDELTTQFRGVSTHLALDLETTGLDAHHDKIVTIAVGMPGQVFILDMRPYYDQQEPIQERWKAALKDLLQLPSITWIGHNLKFDWKFLYAQLGIRLSHVYDTMLAEQLIHGVGLGDKDVSVNLHQTAARYNLLVKKEQRAWFPGLDTRSEWHQSFPEDQIAYMAQDIDVPYHIYQLQRQALQKGKLMRIVQVENQALPALAAMELRGVLIDQTKWRSILLKKAERQRCLEKEIAATLGQALQEAYSTYQQDLQREEQRLMHVYQLSQQASTWATFRKNGLASWKVQHRQPGKPSLTPEGIPTMNLASSTQLLSALHMLHIPAISTRESALEPYAAQYPLVSKILQWKKLQKFSSAFGENILAMIGSDGRLRGDFAQIGAISGRIICSRPNLQQMPAHEKNADENIRRCFVTPQGYKLLKADLSNIELRILAEVSQDITMLQFFAEGKDLHAETAKLMFGLPEDANTKALMYKERVSMRDVAKTINFGLAYGMGAQGLANRVGVPVDTAKALMETYFSTYSGVARWLRQTAQQALKQGYAVTLGGRKRLLPTQFIDRETRGSVERAAKNHPIQGTNADIIKRALTILYETLPEEVFTLLTVHDEIVLECPIEHLEETRALLKKAMVHACREYLQVVSIPDPEIFEDTYWKKD